MSNRFIGKSILASTIAAIGLSSAMPVLATSGTKASQSKRQSKATRLTSTRNAGYYWLKPVNKESFKQARRKQLKSRAKRAAKKKGQV